jgi:antagonist of KipI
MANSILDPGFATTVQDLGRYGYAHLGISPSGAADDLSFRIANLMAGNHENAPALEMTLSGASIQVDEPATIAIAGAECAVELNGNQFSTDRGFQMQVGSILKCGRINHGSRAYLAIQGGLDVPLVLGSASTHLGARFGGWKGRILRKGDLLGVRKAEGARTRVLHRENMPATSIHGAIILRVTRSTHQEWFSPEAFAVLFSKPFTVTEQCGRTGLRLRGGSIILRNTSQVLTDGIPLGAIQVPPDGEPIILFVDQQTTGGYPKIANVIAADMHLVGQLRPRDEINFLEVSIEEAVRLLRERESWLQAAFKSE